MLPSSTKNFPATAFSSVDFPEPLVPMMMTHDPAVSSRLTPRSECTSFGVPGLNVFEAARISSMCTPYAAFSDELRNNQGHEHESGRDQFQIIGAEAPAQRHRHHQSEQHRPHDCPHNR